jgi:hypothetical protein
VKNYYPILVDNLESLREKVLANLPERVFNFTAVTYDHALAYNIARLPEVVSALEQFGGIKQIESIAFNVTPPNRTGKIHTDTGGYAYTFNIPLLNFRNTFLRLHRKTKEPISKTYKDPQGNDINYHLYNKTNCVLDQTIETLEPHIFNTTVPHQVVNPNDTIRINMLIRLKLDTDFSKFN